MEKMPTVPYVALKALEIVSASKQKLFIHNQKELKLTKNPYCTILVKKLKKLNTIFYSIVSFFFREKV